MVAPLEFHRVRNQAADGQKSDAFRAPSIFILLACTSASPAPLGRVLPPGALRPLSQGACGSSLSHGTIATVSGCAIHSAFGRVVASQRTRTYQPRLIAFP